jgi:hypothetical protein
MQIKWLSIISIFFIHIHSGENSSTIILCNLTPLKQTFEQYDAKKQLVAHYVLKQFEVQAIPNVTKFYVKHSETENHSSPVVTANNLSNDLLKIKPTYGNLILFMGSNHFSRQYTEIQQIYKVDTDVSNGYVADIQNRGAVSILEDIMDPNNRLARVAGKYAPLALLKSESLGNKLRFHSLYYCHNERILSILAYLCTWLPCSWQSYYQSYIDLSLQFHHVMDEVCNKFKKREEERKKRLEKLPKF